jgi:hypothetical protein
MYRIGKRIGLDKPGFETYIFIIGFNRTGTRSLAYFFNQNGIPAIHYDSGKLMLTLLENIRSGRRLFHGYDRKYRVFTDVVFSTDRHRLEGNKYFREMYKDYPGSFFILNNRSTESWIESRIKHSGGRLLERQLNALNSKDWDDAINLWRNEKLRHEADVKEFFREDPEHFLEIEIDDPELPRKLSEFLGIAANPEKWVVIRKS